MKVYDCFTFYNEFELLELRLQSLYDVVDYFVIVESTTTHNKEPKKLNFAENKDRYKQYADKIRHIVLNGELIPWRGVGDWSIENAQRNAIVGGLQDAQPDDLIFISDLDEIPAPDVLMRLQQNQLALLMLHNMHVNVNPYRHAAPPPRIC